VPVFLLKYATTNLLFTNSVNYFACNDPGFYIWFVLHILQTSKIIQFLASPFFAQSPQTFTQSTQSIPDLDDGEMRESCPANVCFHGGMCFTKTMPDGTKEFECECL